MFVVNLQNIRQRFKEYYRKYFKYIVYLIKSTLCFLFYLGAVPFQSLYIWHFSMHYNRGGPPDLNSFEKQYLSFLHFIQRNFLCSSFRATSSQDYRSRANKSIFSSYFSFLLLDICGYFPRFM